MKMKYVLLLLMAWLLLTSCASNRYTQTPSQNSSFRIKSLVGGPKLLFKALFLTLSHILDSVILTIDRVFPSLSLLVELGLESLVLLMKLLLSFLSFGIKGFFSV